MKSIDIFLQQNDLKNKTLVEQKKSLRKYLISQRTEQYKKFGETKDWGERQFLNTLERLNIGSLDELQNKFRVSCFFPIRGELNFLKFAQSNWLMPKVIGNHLQWFEYGDGKSDYMRNTWGIPEKEEHRCFSYTSSQIPLLCFVPGLAGDTEHYRLGYGKGYYDRFLAKNFNIISVLCLPSEDFLFDHLPHDDQDQKTTLIVH